MTKKNYLINGIYSFKTICGESNKSSQGPEVLMPVKLTRSEVTGLGKWFTDKGSALIDEYSYVEDYDCMDFINEIRRKIVREDGVTEEDAKEIQVAWNEDLKQDCLKHYRKFCKQHYVIDDYYDFDMYFDGARPSSCGKSGLHVQLGKEDAMEMGKYFYIEDPCEMDIENDFGFREELDTLVVESMVAEDEREWKEEQAKLEAEWKEKHGEDSDEEFEGDYAPDFEAKAYERLVDMYYCWDDQLKNDCIDYYLAHKDEYEDDEEEEEDE